MGTPSFRDGIPVNGDEGIWRAGNNGNDLLHRVQEAHQSHRIDRSPSIDNHDLDQSSIEAWTMAHKLHIKNFASFVSGTPPMLHTVYRILRKLKFGDRILGKLKFEDRILEKMKSVDFGYRINIAEMQRMHLRALQFKLVDTGVALQLDGGDMGGEEIAKHGLRLERLLRDYTQAVQGSEYMTKVSQQPFDFFIASSERYHDSHVLEDALGKRGKGYRDLADDRHITDEHMLRSAVPAGPWMRENKAEALGGTRNASAKAVLRRNFWGKLGGAIVAGAFLVGPMWLLVLKRDLWLNLGVSTVFVFAFGFLMVGCVDDLEGVFASTLGYAAILMVFVGVMFDKQFPE